MRKLSCLLASLAALNAAAMAHEEIDTSKNINSCARYLGNEGVLVTSGETKILFDAFYADSYGQYALVPEETRAALMDARAPYDGVDALFVSHVHGDHFSPGPTLEYLQAHSDVTLYASGQVIEALKAAGGVDEAIASRLKAFDLEAGAPAQTLTIGDLSLDVVRIPHAGGPGRADIENLAFRVTLDDALTVMHMGDADPAEQHFAPYQAHWDAKNLDVLFPPYWFFGNDVGRAIIEDRLKPTEAIGVHVPIASAENPTQWRTKFRADLFTTPGETRAFGDHECQ